MHALSARTAATRGTLGLHPSTVHRLARQHCVVIHSLPPLCWVLLRVVPPRPCVACSAWPDISAAAAERLPPDPQRPAPDFLLPELAGMERLEVLQVLRLCHIS